MCQLGPNAGGVELENGGVTMRRGLWQAAILTLALGVLAAACDTARSVRPLNVSPVVLSLVAFPTTIGPGDSAIVVCSATDADGDTVVFDWDSDCRLVKMGRPGGGPLYNSHSGALVVYAGACARAPADTGWVRCFVRDGRGGGAYAGLVTVTVKQ